jgi:hypothetical protein
MALEIELVRGVGCIVGYAPGIPGVKPVRVSLRKVAERMIQRGKLRPLSEAELRMLDTLGQTEVSGKIAKKIKKAVKKVAAPVVKVAKAVAKSKIVKAVVKVAMKAVPPPASFAIQGAQAAAKLGKALKKGNAKAKKIAPAVKAAAQGKITGAKLQALAKEAGVSPELALQAAAVGKVAELAADGDVKAQAALNVAEQLTSPNVSDQEQAEKTIGQLAVVQAAQSGEARAYMVTAPDGQQYKTLVVPGAAN